MNIEKADILFNINRIQCFIQIIAFVNVLVAHLRSVRYVVLRSLLN